MPKEILFLVEEARAPGFSIYTQGDTLDEVKQMAIDAVRCHFEEDEVPSIIRLHTVKEEVIAV
jgi:predicted RNase H-like HicB family nuclease